MPSYVTEPSRFVHKNACCLFLQSTVAWFFSLVIDDSFESFDLSNAGLYLPATISTLDALLPLAGFMIFLFLLALFSLSLVCSVACKLCADGSTGQKLYKRRGNWHVPRNLSIPLSTCYLSLREHSPLPLSFRCHAVI